MPREPDQFINSLEFYQDMKKNLAQRIAVHAGEDLGVQHWNKAGAVLWPYCTDEVKSLLVMR